MPDDARTKEQLIQELFTLRLQNARLKAAALINMRGKLALSPKAARHLAPKTAAAGLVQRADPRPKKMETRHQENERVQFLAQAIEISDQPFIASDTAGKIIACNPAYCKLTGYTEAELLNLTWTYDLTPIHWHKLQKETMRQLLSSKQPQRYQKEYRRKDGTLVPVEVFVHNISDNQGNLQYYYAFVTDITERRQTEAAQKNSEQRLAAVIDFLPEATLVIDIDGKVTAWNRALENLTGIKAAEMLGKREHEYSLPFYGCRRPLLIDLVLNPNLNYENNYSLIQKEGPNLIAKTEIAKLQGKKRFLWGKATPIFDSSNQLVGAIECIRDLSDRREEEEEFLRISKAVENAGDAILMTDKRGINVTYYNRAFYELFGCTAEEINALGGAPLLFSSLEDAKKVHRAIREGHYWSGELEMRTRDDQIVQVFLRGDVVRNEEGKNIGMFGICTDITEKKQFEKELSRLDRMNLIGEMAAGIAHEIRNPMTTVRGFLQLLNNKPEFLPHEEYFKLMIDELDRANLIITEFLTLGNNKPLDLQLENLNNLITNLLPLIMTDAMLHDKDVNLELGEIRHLRFDQKEMRQLILNLARNGLEAMDTGGTLTIRTYMQQQDVILAIQDQGQGIKPALLEKLGTPFLTTKETGTGLGLAICYSIASRHDAAIKVQTGPEGTVFLVGFKQNGQA